MIKNFIRIGLRNLWWNKTWSVINITGLAVGITSCLVIFTFVANELNYNTSVPEGEDIYRVVRIKQYPDKVEYDGHTPYPLPEALKNDFPDIELVARTHDDQQTLLIFGDSVKINNQDALFADRAFLQMMQYTWISGNPETALDAPGSAVITREFAETFFKGKEAINQVFNLENLVDLRVSGIIENLQHPSNFDYDLLVSFATFEDYAARVINNDIHDWGWTWSGTCWVKTKHPEALEEAFPGFITKYRSEEKNKQLSLELQPLSEVHFDQRFENETHGPVTGKSTLWGFSLIASLILLIACINFVNLATAQAVKRSKEVGVRKVLGSQRKHIVSQFLTEATMITFIAGLIGIIIGELTLPFINQILQTELVFGFTTSWKFTLASVGLLIFVSLLAGFYPAFIMSGYAPVNALKNAARSYRSAGFNLRRALVVVQFGITQILLIGTLVVASQMNYLQEKDLGFSKEAILSVPVYVNDSATIELFRNRLIAQPGVESVSFASGAPTSDNTWTTVFQTEASGETNYRVELKFVDENYFETYDLELLAGNQPLPASMQALKGYVVNESLLSSIGITDPEAAIGYPIIPAINGGTKLPIIGVVKNFHNFSLHEEIMPCILLNIPDYYYHAGIKLNTSDFSKNIAATEAAYSEIFPDYIFEYTFLDEELARAYEWETTVYQGFKIASLIAILVACLGLYGLISFMAVQRTREIGIRKVLGAGTRDILSLLYREFSFLILIAFGIAAPVAWVLMDHWLQNFSFRVSIGLSVFITTLAGAFILSAMSVGLKTYRIAKMNPADSIKTE